jgi:hypothetical protein
LVADPDLATLQVGQPLDLRLAKDHLRAGRPDAEQLGIELGLQPLVDRAEEGIGVLLARLVAWIEADQVKAQDRRVIAADLRQAQGHHVEQARLEHPQAVGVGNARHIDRRVLHVQIEPRRARQTLKERLLLVLLNEARAHRLPQDLQGDRLTVGRRADQGCSDCGDPCVAHIHSLKNNSPAGRSRRLRSK